MHPRSLGFLLAPIAAAAAFQATELRAETWARAAQTNVGDQYDIDLDTATRKGSVVTSWMRVVPTRPRRSPNGKQHTYSLVLRADDCDARRHMLIEAYDKDARGDVVYSNMQSQTWQTTLPESIGEAYWRTACVATKPPEQEPLLADISEGEWESAGESTDKKFILKYRTDKVVRLESGYIVVFSRADYFKPQPNSGFYIDHAVSANLIDCEKARIAYFGADLYFANRRASSSRTAEREFVFEPIKPGSFAMASYSRTCAIAKPIERRQASTAPEADRVGFGTGWAVQKGYIVTASHVVTGGSQITVYSNGERLGGAVVVANDKTNDLAVLKLVGRVAQPLLALPISARPAALGRSVFTLGYPVPGVLGQRIKMAAGEVSSTTGIQDDARQIQVSVPIQQGNSGGPIIAWDGSVLGVVESKLSRFDEEESGPAPEIVNYAVKASYLRPLLEDLPDLANYTLLKAPASPDDLVAEARKAVFLLVVE